jgi:hypothetical protein
VSLLRIIAEGRDSLEFSNLALGSSWIVISNIGKDKSIAAFIKSVQTQYGIFKGKFAVNTHRGL